MGIGVGGKVAVIVGVAVVVALGRAVAVAVGVRVAVGANVTACVAVADGVGVVVVLGLADVVAVLVVVGLAVAVSVGVVVSVRETVGVGVAVASVGVGLSVAMAVGVAVGSDCQTMCRRGAFAALPSKATAVRQPLPLKMKASAFCACQPGRSTISCRIILRSGVCTVSLIAVQGSISPHKMALSVRRRCEILLASSVKVTASSVASP